MLRHRSLIIRYSSRLGPMEVRHFPGAVLPNEDAALIECVEYRRRAAGVSHEARIGDDCRVSVDLHAGSQEVVAFEVLEGSVLAHGVHEVDVELDAFDG